MRQRPLLIDTLFALAVGALAIAGTIAAAKDQTDMTSLDPTAYALLLIGAAGLVLRRKAPGVVVAVTFIATMVYVYLRYPYGPIFLYATVAIYSAAAWRSTRFAVSAVALALLAHVPWSLWGEQEPDGIGFTTLTTGFWLASPLAVGIAVRTNRQAQARALIEEKQRHAYEERLRMAQEVHDVVGHSLAVISMNAGAALHVLSKQPGPPQVTESLRAIRKASSGALDELRTTLAGGQPPGLEMLPTLIQATNVLRISLEVTGERNGIPSTVDAAGYRIVQESLANVVRHAKDATHAVVMVDYRQGEVGLTVTDDGSADPMGEGSGLVSMTERAKALGGTLKATQTPDGFTVTAVLPWK